MKNRYRIYINRKHSGGKIWWIQDNQTGDRESLRTTSKHEAQEMLLLRNRPFHDAGFHAQMARTHLLVSNPENANRTWQSVMEAAAEGKHGSNQIRWQRACASKPFHHIRSLIVANTTADDFRRVLNAGGTAANTYLRRLHNYALDMNWLLAPVIAKRAWPKIKHKEARAITAEEHRRIIEREKNSERRAFYELCWHLGGSQSDMAKMLAENIDWQTRGRCLAAIAGKLRAKPHPASTAKQLTQAKRFRPGMETFPAFLFAPDLFKNEKAGSD